MKRCCDAPEFDSEKNDKEMYSLQSAQQLILKNVQRLPGEAVDLINGLNRTVFSDIKAVIPQPSFDESMRDGYVVPVSDACDKGVTRFEIAGEIAAGKSHVNGLLPGTACRIMTGGCIPKGGERVVPYENCVEEGGAVVVADHLLQSTEIFIRKTGSEITEGERVVQSGVMLQPMHLALLSSSGVRSVVVSARPSVGFVCTGNELTNLSRELEKGQKFSSNSFLLNGLSASFDACSEDLGIIADKKSDLCDFFAQAIGKNLDFLISTGGMGPGKYDLVKDAFVESGGKVILTSLDVRPGKSVLFGILGKTLFFGLPGPPYAVQTLFNVLVGPALLAVQGRGGRGKRKVQAAMQHQIKVKQHDVPRLKDGVLTIAGDRCFVRLAGRLEMSNCYIMLQPGKTHCSEGELVDVYLIATFFD